MMLEDVLKKIISLVLCVLICLSVFAVEVSAETRDTSFEEELAESLKELGLFKGVSETNFALDRSPTRIEALVMLIRVLGKETEAQQSTYTHPFTDVPSWADKYVGFAYATKLTNGVSADKFGSGDASAAMYLTFVLRSLGYSDTNGADFTWSDPYSLAEKVKILPNNVDKDSFLRADVATVSYAALNAQLKDSDKTLAEKLISVGAIDETKYNELYDVQKLNHFVNEGKEELFIPINETKNENEQNNEPQKELPTQTSGEYVLNNNTKKIHYKYCSSVEDIKEENIGYTDDIEYYLSIGYVWCKKCH